MESLDPPTPSLASFLQYSVLRYSSTTCHEVVRPEAEGKITDGLTEMLKGTLEGCVLRIIDAKETYGYAITRRLNELGFTDVTEGTVYTILLRLEKRGLVEVSKRPSEQGPPRKFYALNAAGRRELATFWARWDYLSSRIDRLKESGA